MEGIPPPDDPGLGTIMGELSPEGTGPVLGTMGTSVVKVVCAFVTVVGVDEIGAAPPLAAALEIAPAGLLMGTLVVNVICELAMVTGKDRTGATPLEAPANAVDIAPAGLLIGTWAEKVVPD